MKVARDYYMIEVPGDAADTLEALGGMAIDEARERARLYCMPAEWVATAVRGAVGDWVVVFRVRRTRHRG